MPLRRAFVSLVLVMAVLVAGISAVTIFTCVNVQNQILESVTDYQVLPPQETEDEYNLVIADDEQIVPGENGQLVILSTEYQIANLSDTQRVAYYAGPCDWRGRWRPRSAFCRHGTIVSSWKPAAVCHPYRPAGFSLR